MFDCIDANGADGLRAHLNDMCDFEDAIIAESCARNEIDLIITRNPKDFKLSPVAAMSPSDFARIYKPRTTITPKWSSEHNARFCHAGKQVRVRGASPRAPTDSEASRTD